MSTAFSKTQLFLPGSNDEDTADRCDNHSANKNPTSYLDESRCDAAPDPTVRQSSANDWNAIQPPSSQWTRDNASVLCDGFGVTPHRSTRGSPPSSIRRNDSCALSPSRIRSFIQRSRLHAQNHSATSDSTNDLCLLASHGREIPVIDGINSQTSVDTRDLNDDHDPLIEFDRWLASGAVEITPD